MCWIRNVNCEFVAQATAWQGMWAAPTPKSTGARRARTKSYAQIIIIMYNFNEWPTDIYGNRWYNRIPSKGKRQKPQYKIHKDIPTAEYAGRPAVATAVFRSNGWERVHLFYWIDRMFSTRSASDVFFFVVAAIASLLSLLSRLYICSSLSEYSRARCALAAIYSRIQYHYYYRRRCP